jgi:hypothetical protein
MKTIRRSGDSPMRASDALPVMVYAFPIRDAGGAQAIPTALATLATIQLLQGRPIPETGLEVTVGELDANGFYKRAAAEGVAPLNQLKR